MNWYIAICSLVTGFVLGLIAAKWADVQKLRDEVSAFLVIYNRHNDAWNKSFGRLFDINREILKVHLAPKQYDEAMWRIRDNEMEDA